MITPLNVHKPEAQMKFNPAAFAFRANVQVRTLSMDDLTTKGISYAWRHGRRITSQSPLLNRMIIEWLLEEGSNLNVLRAQVNGNREARYILVRRTLALIAVKYPELKTAVNVTIRKRYKPAGRPPVCIPDGIAALKREIKETNEAEAERRLLEMVLEQKTDYLHLLGHTKVSNEDRALLKARCYKVIGYAYRPLFDLAMAEAGQLAPATVKTAGNAQQTS